MRQYSVLCAIQWSVYWLCVVVVCRRKDWLLENTCMFMVQNDVYYKRNLTILILYHTVQSIIAMTSCLAFLYIATCGNCPEYSPMHVRYIHRLLTNHYRHSSSVV